MMGSSSWVDRVRPRRSKERKATTRIVSSAELQSDTNRLHKTLDSLTKAE